MEPKFKVGDLVLGYQVFFIGDDNRAEIFDVSESVVFVKWFIDEKVVGPYPLYYFELDQAAMNERKMKSLLGTE